MKKLKKIIPLVVAATSLLTVGCIKDVPVASETSQVEEGKIVPEEEMCIRDRVRGWKIPALFLHNLILRKCHIIMCWSTRKRVL